jgi:hypothetical protein
VSTNQDEVPEAVFEQDVADGGSIEGQLPVTATAVVVQGVSLVREAPPLAATFGLIPIQQNTVQSIGRNPRRRRLVLSCAPNVTTTAFVVIGDTAQQVSAGIGLTLIQGQILTPIHYAGQLFVAAFGANCGLGFMAELDQG